MRQRPWRRPKKALPNFRPADVVKGVVGEGGTSAQDKTLFNVLDSAYSGKGL